MAGTLFVVATPIGNLEDITLRAIRVLREAGLIAAEDTRRTARLLTHHGIATRTISFHEHNASVRLPELLEALRSGTHVALVTDAGTPGVSDPGMELVRECTAHGVLVDPVPGASAPLTAAVASGFPLIPLSIYGFAPSRSKDRIEWLKDLAVTPHTFTFFETPHRIEAALRDVVEVFGERPICVGRELTKVHQQFLHGNAGEIAAKLSVPKGEFTVVVGPALEVPAQEPAGDEEVLDEFWRMAESDGWTRRQVISAVAERCGRSARDVYAVVERAKKNTAG